MFTNKREDKEVYNSEASLHNMVYELTQKVNDILVLLQNPHIHIKGKKPKKELTKPMHGETRALVINVLKEKTNTEGTMMHLYNLHQEVQKRISKPVQEGAVYTQALKLVKEGYASNPRRGFYCITDSINEA